MRPNYVDQVAKLEMQLFKRSKSAVWVDIGSEYTSVNDPSAGSPTETLLRLLLPLNGKV